MRCHKAVWTTCSPHSSASIRRQPPARNRGRHSPPSCNATSAKEEGDTRPMPDRPIRIAHLADSHLGYSALTRLCAESGRNQRTVDVERAFETAIDQIIAAGDIDLVLHAGDVFHHSRPPMPSLIFFLKQLRKLDAAGIPIVVIGGNHDTPRLRNAGSVFDVCALVSNSAYFACGYD